MGAPGARFGFLLTRDNEIARSCEEYVNLLAVRYSGIGATVARLSYYKHFKANSLA